MPEFHLDMGTTEAARSFAGLDSFTRGYIEAMFFTDTSSPDDGDLEGACFADLAPEALSRIITDCAAFQSGRNAAMIEVARELVPGSERFRYARKALDDERLGQLFWYARCGHGVSFEDDGNAVCLHFLQGAAERFRNVDLYRGDDGLVYLA